MRNSTGLGFSIVVAILASNVLAFDSNKVEKVSFNRDIRPILSDHCFACHGPDKNRRESNLRLDIDQDQAEVHGIEHAVDRNKAEESLLLRKIRSTDASERMPPPSFAKDLSPEQMNLLQRWIEQGASFEGHWAFEPIKRAALPEADLGSLPAANEIDRFLNVELKRQQIVPSEQADRITLIRRLSFDLLGLPPSTERVNAFLRDSRIDAYDRLVDEFLDSEHFGERMAVWWLDLVRYADSVGYHGDQPVSVSPYRDYVIRSFNQNKPFDQFTVEQLAGDLLPNASIEQKIAAGYNRLGMMSAEGGVQDKEYLAKYIAERVRNVGGTWMGVTLGCCECHDHKYDPFLTRDFYSFEAFFADIEEKGLYAGANSTGAWGASMKVPNQEQTKRIQQLDQSIHELKEILATPTRELREDQRLWEDAQRNWHLPAVSKYQSKNGSTLTLKSDGSFLASGENPPNESYTIEMDSIPPNASALRIELLPDPSLPHQGPGRASNGNLVLSEIRFQKWENVEGDPKDSSEWKEIPLKNASASFEQTESAKGNPYGKWSIAAAIDGDKKGAKWGWGILGKIGQPHDAVLHFPAQEPSKSTQYRVILEQNLDNPQHTIGRFRISFSSDSSLSALENADATLFQGLTIEPVARDPMQRKALEQYYLQRSPRLSKERASLAALEKEKKELEDSIPSTLVTKTVEPRMIRVLARGNWMDDQGEMVEPNFPRVLHRGPSHEKLERRLTRLDLAKWLVSKEHPLTSRVLVNRLWKQFYGAGISRRLDDFGSQGEPPSHPELLDWLAQRMIHSQWDLKQMIRLLVTSSAYRRSSNVADKQWQTDPTNRFLSRQVRHRLDAEFLRDNALAVSDLLVRRVGGVSVKPYQPPGYWAYLNFPQREWQNGEREDLYRRGLYTHWQRQYLHPSLVTFDAPNREECTAERMKSNTPLQSLVLLNDPTFVEAARALALSELRGKGGDIERLQRMAMRALSRDFQPEESDVLLSLLRKHRMELKDDPEKVNRFLGVGQSRVPDDVDRVELAAWTNVGRTILNLHEVITRP